MGGCGNGQATTGQDDPWPMYDPLCTLVHSTEKGDVICYYGNRGESKPIVLEPGESALVGGDKVGAAPLGTPPYFFETKSLSYFSPGTVLFGHL